MSRCPTRVVLDGNERECSVRGPHKVHKYRGGDGRVREYEFVVPALYRKET